MNEDGSIDDAQVIRLPIRNWNSPLTLNKKLGIFVIRLPIRNWN